MASGSNRSDPQIQYQHYIPRFILRKFLEEQDPPRTSKQRSKAYWKAKKKGIETELLNIYDFSTQTLETRTLAKSFGESNLYTDITHGIDSQIVEKKLSLLENEAARVIETIHKCNKGSFVLTRQSLGILRKFVYIMHFRTPRVREMYFGKGRQASFSLLDWMDHYVKEHNLKSTEDIWLKCLSYILDTPHSNLVREGELVQAQYPWDQWMKMLQTRVEPGINFFAMDYQSLANAHYLGVWEAAPGTEFVVANNSFGLWEGIFLAAGLEPATQEAPARLGESPSIHRIFVISPKLALILRENKIRMIDEEFRKEHVRSSLIDVNMEDPVICLHGTPSLSKDATTFQEAMWQYRTTPAAKKTHSPSQSRNLRKKKPRQ